MKKNVASQVVGVQMVSATDGSAFTGSVSVTVTGDGGTQGAGAGTGPTHEGNGLHTYVPTQAETNYDHVAFTFTGTGAVPSTVQVYTAFPQTGDSYARLGAPVGASISADIAGVQSDTDNIQTRIPAALVSGRMDASVGAYQSGLTPLQPTTAGRTLDVTATGEAGIDWANIGSPTTAVNLSGTTVKTATDVETDTADIQTRIPAALVSGRIDASVGAMAADTLTSTALAASAVTEIQSGLSTLDAAGVRTAVGLASANLDTQIGTLATGANLATVDTVVDAIKAKTDSLAFTVAGQVDANVQYVNDVAVTGTGAPGDEWGP